MSARPHSTPASPSSLAPAARKWSRSRLIHQWSDLFYSFTRRRLAVAGALVFGLILILSVAAPWIAPHNPNSQDLSLTLLPPAWSPDGDPRYLLGTDHFGRDIVSRLLYGANVSLRAASSAALFALVIGVLIGLIAGFYGGLVESLLMRVVDIFLAFPLILLALALAAILKPSLRSIILVMGLTGWMVYARVIRSAVVTIKTQEYVAAAVSIGASSTRIIFVHILPNIVAPALVLFTFGFAQFIIMESALSFLGLGVPPPTPTWGRMLNDGRDYLTIAPWIITFPGLSIMLAALCLNFVGDGLRDALDPRLRRLA